METEAEVIARGSRPGVVLVDSLGRRYRSKPGRKPRNDTAASDGLSIRLTIAERTDLESVAKESGTTLTEVLREAVNEYVADYRDRAVFRR